MPVSLESSGSLPSRATSDPTKTASQEMLRVVGAKSLDELIDQTIPAGIRLRRALDLPPRAQRARAARAGARHRAEERGLAEPARHGLPRLRHAAGHPAQRLENPGWYTQYTPYQAEVSQGRLEALLNFQTMVSDLTALPVANASLLDEATAAAEAMHMMEAIEGRRRPARAPRRTTSATRRPSTSSARAPRRTDIEVVVGDPTRVRLRREQGVRRHRCSTRRPTGGSTTGRGVIERAHAAGAMVTMACDLLALALVAPPGEMGADIAVGSAQRFGVPLGYGGPHAAFFACKNELVRKLPGRIIGVSVDAHGKPALRMALQTREQHIRREKATSNVCTAQALLANVAGLYAVYHGPEGIRAIAERVHGHAAAPRARPAQARASTVAHDALLRHAARRGGRRARSTAGCRRARARKMNLRRIDERSLGIALDETTSAAEVDSLLAVFHAGKAPPSRAIELAREAVAGPRRPRAHERVPDAPRLQRAPLRDGDAALHALARGAGPLARALDDPARARAR